MTKKETQEMTNFLKGRKLMSLGTYNRFPWAACVYFVYDNDLNFYFVSDPKTKHCKNIEVNPRVSVTVVNSEQDPEGKKVGFQASGVAKLLKNEDELKKAIKGWNKRGFEPVTYKEFKEEWVSKFYKIKLNRLQMFDQRLGEEGEVRYWTK